MFIDRVKEATERVRSVFPTTPLEYSKRLSKEYKADIYHIEGVERPPMIEIPDYREKFGIKEGERETK